MKKSALFILALFFLFSCGELKTAESIDFLEPQPSGIKDETSIPKKYQGRYSNCFTSACMLIQEDRIIRYDTSLVSFTRNDLDSTFEGDPNDNQQLIAGMKKYGIEVTQFDGDTIYGTIVYTDTLFSISPDNICRYYKGSCFLSYNYGEGNWKVQQLDLEKNHLVLSIVMPRDSVGQQMSVEEMVKLRNDSGVVTRVQIKPSRKELKQLFREKTFTESEIWLKLK